MFYLYLAVGTYGFFSKSSPVPILFDTQKIVFGLAKDASLQSYSLYPFLSSRSLPWDAGTGSLFRLRRVGEWLRVNSGEGVLAETGGTALNMNE
jgi:hypothetical protein